MAMIVAADPGWFGGFLSDDPDEPLIWVQVREWVWSNGHVVASFADDDLEFLEVAVTPSEGWMRIPDGGEVTFELPPGELEREYGPGALLCLNPPGHDRQHWIAVARAELLEWFGIAPG